MPRRSTTSAGGQPEAADTGDVLVIDEDHCCARCRFCRYVWPTVAMCCGPEDSPHRGGTICPHEDCCDCFERKVEG